MRTKAVTMRLMLAGLLVSSAVWSGTYQEKDRAELAKAVAEAKVSLDQGLAASAREGKPI